MALKRIVGTAIRHPLASTAAVVGVAKGTIVVVRRLVGGENPLSHSDEETPADPTAPEAAVPTETVKEPEVVPLEPEDRDLPEPVVIEAVDEDPEPAPDPEGHVELEEELVWTSESPQPSE